MTLTLRHSLPLYRRLEKAMIKAVKMKNYGVKELAKLSGVSVRTLHHYDKIGLLQPLSRTEAGYRYYGEEELLRLQQILFYKELDFTLKEIKELLDEPDFDVMEALKSHKTALEARQERISKLLDTIDHTINHLKNGEIMSDPKSLYKGLPKEVGTTYRDEAMKKYGKENIENAEADLLKLGKDGFKNLQASFEDVNNELFVLRSQPYDGERVQNAIARHFEIIKQFWGSSVKKEQHLQVYKGLGQLYLNDVRYTKINGKEQPEFARFMQKAMKAFVDTKQ